MDIGPQIKNGRNHMGNLQVELMVFTVLSIPQTEC